MNTDLCNKNAWFTSRYSLVYVLPMRTAPFAVLTNDSTTQVDDALYSAEGKKRTGAYLQISGKARGRISYFRCVLPIRLCIHCHH